MPAGPRSAAGRGSRARRTGSSSRAWRRRRWRSSRAIVAEALEKRRIGDVAASRERASRILADAEAAVARARAENPAARSDEPEASLATARAFHARLAGRDDPAHWAELAARWLGPRPAVPGGDGPLAPGRGDHERRRRRPGRRPDRTPASSAARPASRCPRRSRSRCSSTRVPCCGELRELAGRALISLPPEVETLLEEAPAPAEQLPPAASPPIAEAQALGGMRPARRHGHRHVRAVEARARGARRSSPRAAPTARSATGCSSARRPSASTSATSWPSSASRVASRRPRWRSGSVSRRAAPARLTRRGFPRRHASPAFGRIGGT